MGTLTLTPHSDRMKSRALLPVCLVLFVAANTWAQLGVEESPGFVALPDNIEVERRYYGGGRKSVIEQLSSILSNLKKGKMMQKRIPGQRSLFESLRHLYKTQFVKRSPEPSLRFSMLQYLRELENRLERQARTSVEAQGPYSTRWLHH